MADYVYLDNDQRYWALVRRLRQYEARRFEAEVNLAVANDQGRAADVAQAKAAIGALLHAEETVRSLLGQLDEPTTPESRAVSRGRGRMDMSGR